MLLVLFDIEKYYISDFIKVEIIGKKNKSRSNWKNRSRSN